jgi:3'-phosphoadenosine 5'-phosphosulfate sulfotransferase (PAPS reductase)/FAD synthetase
MDTLIEDDDNYRFLDEMEARWLDVYELSEVERIAEGRTPYEVHDNYVPSQKRARCTYMLKIQPFTRYVSDLGGDITIHIGYDFAEVHRCEATEKAYNRLGWSVDFPLLWRPLEHRPYVQVCRDDWGIEPPRMYELGYTHANCGGACVKQGLGDWRRTLANFPERYEQVEKWERDMRDHPVRQAYAILRDQSNGTVTAKTLEELRGEVEAGAKVQPSLFDFDSACVNCGVGLV